MLLLALAGPVVSAAADLLPAQIEAGCAGRRVAAVRFAGAIRLNRVLDEVAWVRAEAGACWHRFEPARRQTAVRFLVRVELQRSRSAVQPAVAEAGTGEFWRGTRPLDNARSPAVCSGRSCPT